MKITTRAPVDKDQKFLLQPCTQFEKSEPCLRSVDVGQSGAFDQSSHFSVTGPGFEMKGESA